MSMEPEVDALHSSEAFIRALKSPHDPPSHVTPSKIDLALQAWEKNDLYIPGKAEVIADWALNRLLKDRADPNVLLDHRYWQLLASICSKDIHGSSQLHSIVLRVPTLPIFSSVLGHLHDSQALHDEYFDDVTRVYEAIASTSIQKTTADALYHLLKAVVQSLSVAARLSTAENVQPRGLLRASVIKFVSVVLKTILDSLESCSSKKRLLSMFLNGTISLWGRSLHNTRGAELKALRDCAEPLTRIGQQILFNADTLRSWTEDPSTWQTVLDLIQEDSEDPAIFDLLPVLLSIYISRIRDASFEFPPSSTSPLGSGPVLQTTGPVIQRILDALRTLICDPAWACREGILAAILREHLYDSSDDTWHSTITSEAQAASLHLQRHCRTQEYDHCLEAVHILELILQIDFSVFEGHFPSILSACVRMEIAIDAAFTQVLERSLSSYSRTRSLPIILAMVCDTISEIAEDGNGEGDNYIKYATGPLFSTRWEEALGKAIANFLPAGQLLAVCKHINATLLSALPSHSEETSVEPKRRKLNSNSQMKRNMQRANTSFALLTRYVTFFYSTLLSWEAAEDTLQIIVEQLEVLNSGLLSETTKIFTPSGATTSEASYDRNVISLLMLFELSHGKTLTSGIPKPNGERLSAWLLSKLSSTETADDLWIESLRFYLLIVQNDTPRASEDLMKVLDPVLRRMSSAAPSTTHTFDIRKLSRPLLTEVLTVIDTIGTDSQIVVACQVLIDACCSGWAWIKDSTPSASLWELPRIREKILTNLQALCNPLVAADLPKMLDQSGPQPFVVTYIQKLMDVLPFLICVPPTYLSRAERTWLINALTISDLFSASEKEMPDLQSPRLSAKALVATLLADKIPVYLPWVDILKAHLIDARASDSALFLDASLRLNNAIQGQIFATSKKSFDNVGLLISMYLDLHSRYTITNDVQHARISSIYHSLSDFLDGFRSYHQDRTNISIEILGNMSTFCNQISADLPSRIVLQECLQSYSLACALTRAWRSLVAFQIWANIQVDGASLFIAGVRALYQVIRSPSGPQSAFLYVSIAIFDVIVRVWQLSDEKQRREHFVVIYELYRTLLERGAGGTEMDDSFGAVSKCLHPDERQKVVQKLSKRCENAHYPATAFALDLHELTSLLVYAPPGQQMRALCSYVVQHISWRLGDNCSVHIILPTLQFLTKFTENTMPLTQIGVEQICSVLASCLRPSRQHTSVPEIFSHVVELLMRLLRSQRQLLVNALPSLTHSFSTLMLSLRTIRPHLGVQQSRAISDDQPSWVDVHAPLTAKQAGELARLMCALEVKTATRGHQRAKQIKLESLAKPFARHASSLLKTYTDMITDPLGYVDPEIRRALQPGLFALCGLVNESDRDSLMVSLNRPTSKALLRALWQEYQKQRYTGKG